MTAPENTSFHVMAKPVGARCNLDCAYCFYLNKEKLPGGPPGGHMSDELLERFIEQYIQSQPGSEVVFSWQGGEPMLLGLEFFQKVVAYQKRYARPGQRIGNNLQTNGTLMSEEWCAFLKENCFLVGLSVDGPREIHDHYRKTKNLKPTFDAVFSAANLLHRYDIPFNTLTCVHRFNGRRPLDVYKFLRQELNSHYIQFIPVVQHKDSNRTSPSNWNRHAFPKEGSPLGGPAHPDSIVTPWSVDPDDWGYFLCRVFDRWLSQDLGKVMVNQFETLVARRLGAPPQLCVYSETCGNCLALETDGSVFSCDHYVYPEYRLGNIQTTHLRDIACSPLQRNFAKAKSDDLPQLCHQCPYLADCWGECPKNRLIRTAEGEPGLNYLCRGFRTFFAHALPGIELIVSRLRSGRTLKPGGLAR
jgi:uncharacterized protein